MVNVYECYWATFLRTNKVTVEFDQLYDTVFIIQHTRLIYFFRISSYFNLHVETIELHDLQIYMMYNYLS